MKHEKIFKREDGSKVRISVEYWTDFRSSRWFVMASVCDKRKRTWTTPVNHDDYSWRCLNSEGRDKEDLRRCLLICTKDEIQETMLECWEKMKPDFYEQAKDIV